jgi:hypothetical protein
VGIQNPGRRRVCKIPEEDTIDSIRCTPCVFIFSRIKKSEDQGKERRHGKPVMSNETNERPKYTLNMSVSSKTVILLTEEYVYYESIK